MNIEKIAKNYKQIYNRFNIQPEKEEPIFSILTGNGWRDYTTDPANFQTLLERETKNLNGQPYHIYMATGIFKKRSIRLENKKIVGRNVKNLVRIPVILLDLDYISYLLYKKQVDRRDPKNKKIIEEYESKLHNLSNEQLDKCLDDHLALIKSVLKKAKIPYSEVVISGYGYYVKIDIAFDDQERIEEIREFHKSLVAYLNKLAGFDLCDPQCTDAGTRDARIKGSCNLKNPKIPRKVSLIEDNGSSYNLDDLIKLVPQRERDADRPEHAKSYEGEFPRKEVIDICKQYYFKTNRNDLVYNLSAFIFKNGGSLYDAIAIVEALAIEHKDEEIQNRLAVVRNTHKKFQAREEIRGYEGLKETLSEKDLEKITSLFTPKKYKVPWPRQISEQAFYGLAGKIVRTIEPHSEADSVALLVNYLTAFGNCAGDKPYFRVGADIHGMRLFSVLVGDTSKARKGLSWGYIKHLFKIIDPDWVSKIQTGLSSGEGLIWAVRDEIRKKIPVKVKGRVVDYEEVIVEEGIDDKRLLVLESEFSQTLRMLGRDGNILSPVIRNAWDSGDLQTLTKNSPAKATDAHISIIGHIGRDELLRYLTSTEAGNGFGNRFTWFCVKRSKPLPFGGEFHKVNLEPLIKDHKRALEFASKGGEIKWAKETKPLWEKVYTTLSEGKPGLIGALTARAEANVTRLSCIYALLDKSLEIEPDHLRAALSIWDYVEASVKFIFQNKIGDPLVDELLKALSKYPSGMTRTDLSNYFGRHKTSEQITSALNIALSLGLVRKESIPTEGRTSELWILN